MKVREVLYDVTIYLGMKDSMKDLEDESVYMTDELKLLLRCFNLAENELALDYIPLKARERFVPQDGVLEYTRFSKPPVDVLSVRDGRGKEVRTECFPAHLLLPADTGEVEVTYAYAPAEKTDVEQECDHTGKISARLLALGVAAEFLISGGRYSEAAEFRKKFLDAVRAANVLRRKLATPSRRWV